MLEGERRGPPAITKRFLRTVEKKAPGAVRVAGEVLGQEVRRLGAAPLSRGSENKGGRGENR